MSNSSKCKVSFRYSNSQCPSDTGDGLSAKNQTSRISYGTFNSAFSVSSSRSQRINQIQPKPKLKLKQKGEEKEQESKGKKNKQEPVVETIPNQSLESMSYNSIKPLFGWKKYTILCGFQRGMGRSGCQCEEPCKWKQKWTKNYKQQNFKLYKKIQKQKPLESNVQQILKDLPRSHSDCPTFSGNIQYREMLKEVLITYSIYDPQIGYVQGMNMIAGVLLYHIKNTQLSFWAFADLMDDQELRQVYLDGFIFLKQHCQIIDGIIMSKINDLYNHMKQLEVNAPVFLYGWLLSLMSTCIPLEYMHEVIDRFRDAGWKFIYQLVITYLLFLKQYLLLSSDAAEFLTSVNTKNSRQLGIQWQQMIENCHKVKIVAIV